MTSQGAEKAITSSALIVAGIYIYRRMTEGSGAPSGSKAAQLLGRGSPPSVGTFVTAWGAAFLVISIMATASPGLGGSFAILAATADVLSNGQQIFGDVNAKLGSKTKGKAGAPANPGPQALAQATLLTPPNTLHWTPYAGIGALR